MIDPDVLNLLIGVGGGIGIGALAIILAAVIFRSDEIVIGHIERHTAPAEPLPDPHQCQHVWDDGIRVEMRSPNRWDGRICERCGAILWENGDITIERGRGKR